ncbi:hypothetical protein LTR53_009211 [Teratosphaeriaceae sp. CCFEE 6253]|nr:hypothetical protein LTR53_009211 [Teratosphaeriaceae sp. CCFEE 6253]
MPTSWESLLVLLLAAQTTRALIPSQPTQTPIAQGLPDGILGWSPKPTTAPHDSIRAKRWGALPMNQLFARQDENQETCGYIDSDPNQPVTCSGYPDSGCAYWESTSPGPPNFWCCAFSGGSPDFSQCNYVSSCLNAGDSDNVNVGNVALYNGGVIDCPTPAPYCVTTALLGPSGTLYSQFNCGSASDYIVAYQTTSSTPTTILSTVLSTVPTTLQSIVPTTVNNTVATTVLVTSIPTSRSPATVSATSSDAPSTTGTQSAQSAAPTSSDAPAPSPTGSSHTKIAAIAGGTIGGVAALALVGAAIGFLAWRKKSQRKPMREVSQINSP